MEGLTHQLAEAGLTPIQARTYLALLKIGPAGASDIAKTAGVHRVTCYTALQELQDMGLALFQDDTGIREYRAGSLEKLEKLFMEKAQNAIEAYRHIQTLVPDLEQIGQRVIEYPRAYNAEGHASVNRYLEAIPEDNLLLAGYISHEDDYGYVMPFAKRASDANKRPRIIIPNSIKPNLLVYLDHRVIPAKMAHIPTSALIFPDRIIIMWHHGHFPQVFVLDDKRISDHYLAMFDLNWRLLSGEHMVVATNEE